MPKTLMWEPDLLEKNLGGRTYIVTRANSGAGLATAQQLARQGAQWLAPAAVSMRARRPSPSSVAFPDPLPAVRP